MIDDSGRDWHLTSDWHLRWVKTPTLFSKTPPFFWGGVFRIKIIIQMTPFFFIYTQGVKCLIFFYTQTMIFWIRTQNSKPFHWKNQGILHRGYKTFVHFLSLPTGIRLIISIDTNSSFFLYHIILYSHFHI
jgi:hypothetical protein